ncbi:stomatin family protein [Alternaria alternata]|nr:stomatin family protein [Alternaria alternata]
MSSDLYRLTASEISAKIKAGETSVEEYAKSLLARIESRDEAVQAWAYLDPEYVIKQARALDAIPTAERGPLHGVAIAVKDVIYTKEMPTQFNSPIYANDAPQVDAGSIAILRKNGALIFGKTTTTEFAATTTGPKTRNPHDPKRTPGGSSSGSGAAVGDFQAPIGLGTQTGGSTIRPGSYNGIYALKPTWNSITREGQKIYSLILDTLGLYARSVADLELLADAFAIHDDAPPPTDYTVKGAKFAFLKTMVWPNVGPGTSAALDKAVSLLRAHGAEVEEIEFPEYLNELPNRHATVLNSDGRTAFLPEYTVAKDKISEQLVGHVENSGKISRKAQLEAFDEIAAARPIVDDILGRYDAVLTPSVPDEAPLGIEKTGSAAFCLIWTALHTPVVNVPGFKGENGMPIGISLVAPRYHDRRLLAVSKKVASSVRSFSQLNSHSATDPTNVFASFGSSSSNSKSGLPSYFSSSKRLPTNTVIRFVPQQTAWIVERMGKFNRILEPGLAVLIPFIDRIAYVRSLKENAIEIPSQSAITADNVTLELDGVLYTRVFDAYKASYGVEDAEYAISQLAQTTMRSEIGQLSLDHVLKERANLNANITAAINEAAQDWGVTCLRYEIRDIHAPEPVVEAMHRQVTAERSKRAEILESEGQRQSAINIAEGKKQSVILASEALRAEQINMANGEAEAILLKATATANGIDAVARSISQGGGAAQNAISLSVAEKYVDAFGNLAKEGTSIVVPGNVGDMSGMIASAMAVYGNVNASQAKAQASKMVEGGNNKQIQELQSKLNDAESGSNQMHNEINRVMDERLNKR